jgi:hypothetical protein
MVARTNFGDGRRDVKIFQKPTRSEGGGFMDQFVMTVRNSLPTLSLVVTIKLKHW